jgi:putative ABC transport system permease protein
MVTLLAMANGVRLALRATGLRENAIVTQKGALSELTSSIPKDQLDFIVVDARVKREPGTTTPLASPEMFIVAGLPYRGTDAPTNTSIRGITPMALKVRAGIEIVGGRMFTPGLYEIIIGKQILPRLAGAEIGRTITIQKKEWNIVGVFAADGSGFESEIWMDAKVMSQAFNRREMYQSVTVRLDGPQALEALQDALAHDPKTQVAAKEERQYYEDQAGQIVRSIVLLAGFVAAIMGIGAVFGGMNTMYSIVAARSREIGTLRAVGFSRWSVLLAFLIESVLLALVGAVLGCILASFTGGMSGATGGPNFSQMAFEFRVTADAIAAGVAFAVAMGILGGLLPAVRAARLPIAAALKEN